MINLFMQAIAVVMGYYNLGSNLIKLKVVALPVFQYMAIARYCVSCILFLVVIISFVHLYLFLKF